MLDLNAPEWDRLRHAYGNAADVPDLIRRLQRDAADGEAWEGLWSALCHQFDVYEATYAALPHVIRLMGGLPLQDRVEAANFIGTAAACAARPAAPAVPASLAGAYELALREADGLLLDSLAHRAWDVEAYKVLFGALAAVRGEAALALDVFEAGAERSCPGCEASIPPYSAEVLKGEA